MAKTQVIAATDPLPSFIIDRDKQAQLAGLRLERYIASSKYGDDVISRYHGSKQHIAASGFLWTKKPHSFHWPRGRVPSGACGPIFTQYGGTGGSVYRNEDGSFLVHVADKRPVALTRLGPELERFEVFAESKLEQIVHYGSREALLAARITTEGAIPEDRKYGGMHDENGRTWETSVAPNGWWLHERHLDRERAVEQKKKSEIESRRVNFEDPDEYREFIEDLIVMHSKITAEILRSYASVETIHDVRYTLDAAQLAELIKSIQG